MTSFLNDQGLEIQYSGGDFSITKQVATFKNFKIKGDVSVSIQIPNTSDNRKTLGYSSLNHFGTIFAAGKFNLVKNGNILMRGDIVIEEVTPKEITIYFISGNANWFKLLDFSCKDISNNGYQVKWTHTGIFSTLGNKKGIVFPLIDYMFARDKFDKEGMFANVFGLENDGVAKVNNFPCLYINTLVSEISVIARVKFAGNLFDDKLYQSLIITPEGPDLYNSSGLITPIYSDTSTTPDIVNNTIHIEDIAPDIKALEIIKYLCFKFGCIPVFDVYTMTLNVNIFDKIIESEDWSEYIQDFTIKYDQKQYNTVTVKEASEEEIQLYNADNEIPYGELLIESDKTDGSTLEIYKDPFAPAMDNIGTTPLRWATPFVQFYDLEDDEPIRFLTVTNVSGKAAFNAPINLELDTFYGFVFRIEDDNGVYQGYHLNGAAATQDQLQSLATYSSTSSGYIYPQKISKVDGGPRILVCVPNYNVNNFIDAVFLVTNTDVNKYFTDYAYWHKPYYSAYLNLSAHRPGLSWGDIPDGSISVAAEIVPTPPAGLGYSVYTTYILAPTGALWRVAFHNNNGVLRRWSVTFGSGTTSTLNLPYFNDSLYVVCEKLNNAGIAEDVGSIELYRTPATLLDSHSFIAGANVSSVTLNSGVIADGETLYISLSEG